MYLFIYHFGFQSRSLVLIVSVLVYLWSECMEAVTDLCFLYMHRLLFCYSFMSMLITDCLDSFCTIFTLSDFFVNVSQKLFPRHS